MSNMSYCRFRNTLNDLRDCSDHFDDNDDLLEEERAARTKLVDLCSKIAEDHEDDGGEQDG
jgi:hypothetical protein